jgi:hypothetical protein
MMMRWQLATRNPEWKKTDPRPSCLNLPRFLKTGTLARKREYGKASGEGPMQTGSIAVGVAMALIWMSWAPPARATQCGGPEDPVIKAAVDGHDTKEFHIVADWALAKAIRRRCPQGRLELSITLGQTVHVWMRSAGNDKALERLIRDKRLPLGTSGSPFGISGNTRSAAAGASRTGSRSPATTSPTTTSRV